MDYREQKIIDKLVTARIALLLKHPFFGNLATRLKLVNADAWCQTAGTDGRHFFYNTKFIDSLTPKESEFLSKLKVQESKAEKDLAQTVEAKEQERLNMLREIRKRVGASAAKSAKRITWVARLAVGGGLLVPVIFLLWRGDMAAFSKVGGIISILLALLSLAFDFNKWVWGIWNRLEGWLSRKIFAQRSRDLGIGQQD